MSFPESMLNDTLCLRHRCKSYAIWRDALAKGYSSEDAREYARLEILRMVQAGEIQDDLVMIPVVSRPATIVELIKDPVVDIPLPINPPHAPRQIKLRPRKARLPFCKPAPVPVNEDKRFNVANGWVL